MFKPTVLQFKHEENIHSLILISLRSFVEATDNNKEIAPVDISNLMSDLGCINVRRFGNKKVGLRFHVHKSNDNKKSDYYCMSIKVMAAMPIYKNVNKSI